MNTIQYIKQQLNKRGYKSWVLQQNPAYIVVKIPKITEKENFEHCNLYTNVSYNFDKHYFQRYNKDLIDCLLNPEINEQWVNRNDFSLPIFEIWEDEEKALIFLEEVEVIP